jgi:hypothetical protein
MNKNALVPLALTTALLAGCAAFRWSGSPDPELSRNWVWSTGDLMISTQPAASAPPAVVPEKLPDTLYYADLGPETIDVSSYTAQQRYNYRIFERECSRCHTLARAINSPTESRLYWKFHLTRMSLHSRFDRQGRIPPAETKALLDFLEYDAKIRKVQDRKRFDEQTEELKRRFEPILEKVLSQMRTSGRPPLNDQSW